MMEMPPEPLQMDDVRIDPMIALRLPAQLAMRREVLPFVDWQGNIHVACAETRDSTTFSLVQRSFEKPIHPCLAEPTSLRRALQRIYSGGRPGAAPASTHRPSTGARGSEPDVIDVAAISEEILHSALLRQASDIHIDPGPESLRVRFRVDGTLEEIQRYPTNLTGNLVNRIKVLAQMDISEKRSPQDGAFRFAHGEGKSIDIRAATLPTKWGERITLRLLGLQTGALTLERLGMGPMHLEQFGTALAQPHGMILLTGPTGSGKSTTLYAAIRRLLDLEPLNVITVEDPVEYDIAGVAQVSVDAVDKTSFAKALRSILRHDPDVVMIGEIRDGETAGIAVKAALTGHLVFSSLHTNTAAGAVTRLGDMGVERYLIASTLRLSIAQRLVKKLCPRCRTTSVLTKLQALALNQPAAEGTRTYESAGCLYCGGRGYGGRVALFEFLSLDETWAQTISRGAQEVELIEEMHRRKMPTLIDDALLKLNNGTTTFEQVTAAVAVW